MLQAGLKFRNGPMVKIAFTDGRAGFGMALGHGDYGGRARLAGKGQQFIARARPAHGKSGVDCLARIDAIFAGDNMKKRQSGLIAVRASWNNE
jgi:hypothetical protein